MPEEKFKVGDVVILKSGGPKMTVEDVEAGDTIVCQWFVDGKKLEYGSFPADSLERAESGPRLA